MHIFPQIFQKNDENSPKRHFKRKIHFFLGRSLGPSRWSVVPTSHHRRKLLDLTLRPREFQPDLYAYNCKKSSAVAEMGDRLAKIGMGRKVGAAVPLYVRRSWSPSNTMSPWVPISIPSGILIHPAVWPQQTWAEKLSGCAVSIATKFCTVLKCPSLVVQARAPQKSTNHSQHGSAGLL